MRNPTRNPQTQTHLRPNQILRMPQPRPTHRQTLAHTPNRHTRHTRRTIRPMDRPQPTPTRPQPNRHLPMPMRNNTQRRHHTTRKRPHQKLRLLPQRRSKHPTQIKRTRAKTEKNGGKNVRPRDWGKGGDKPLPSLVHSNGLVGAMWVTPNGLVDTHMADTRSDQCISPIRRYAPTARRGRLAP